MSTPVEQAHAVIAAEAFLREMADPHNVRATMPAFRRDRARAILRHLPTAAEWASVLTVYADSAHAERRQAMRDEFALEAARRGDELRALARRVVAPKKEKRRGR